ncbi:Alpha/beta hydrolase fold-3 [Penicillium solitum]|uniref:Alpha/beta hydrolase fold-3 n=1 Tax=Penicillium solitum TaxID=60172 RepID=UPI0032C441C4|nr:Alpha/beta hydrolase fold-3 [Penicillium solitum]
MTSHATYVSSCHCNMYCQHCSIPRSKGGGTAHKHIALSFTRALFRYASMEQIQLVLTPASAEKSYKAYMSQQKASPNILVLAEGTTAFWLGAYCLPALPSHFTHLEALSADIKQHGNGIGALFLAYSLPPKPDGLVSCNRLLYTTAPRKPQRAGGEGPSRFKNLCWRGRRRSPVGSDSGDGREDEVCHHQVELPDVSISIVPREFHVEPITDFALKLPPGLQFKAMTLWLNQTFSE